MRLFSIMLFARIFQDMNVSCVIKFNSTPRKLFALSESDHYSRQITSWSNFCATCTSCYVSSWQKAKYRECHELRISHCARVSWPEVVKYFEVKNAFQFLYEIDILMGDSLSGRYKSRYQPCQFE